MSSKASRRVTGRHPLDALGRDSRGGSGHLVPRPPRAVPVRWALLCFTVLHPLETVRQQSPPRSCFLLARNCVLLSCRTYRCRPRNPPRRHRLARALFAAVTIHSELLPIMRATSITPAQWLFPLSALIHSTPSRTTSNIPVEKELYDRARGVEFLFRLAVSLGL